jgi:hypothetical protein
MVRTAEPTAVERHHVLSPKGGFAVEVPRVGEPREPRAEQRQQLVACGSKTAEQEAAKGSGGRSETARVRAQPRRERCARRSSGGILCRFQRLFLCTRAAALGWVKIKRRQGEVAFFVTSQSAVTRVLCAIWTDAHLNARRRRQWADWVLLRWVGHAGRRPNSVRAPQAGAGRRADGNPHATGATDAESRRRQAAYGVRSMREVGMRGRHRCRNTRPDW